MLALFLYLEIAALLLLVVLVSVAQLSPGKLVVSGTVHGLRSCLRVLLLLLWVNALAFIFFFLAYGLTQGGLSSAGCGNTPGLGVSVSACQGMLLTVALLLKLFLPPLQFLLVLLYTSLPSAALAAYFMLYYVYVIPVVYFLFSNLVVTMLAS